jgi:hypothetical protein
VCEGTRAGPIKPLGRLEQRNATMIHLAGAERPTAATVGHADRACPAVVEAGAPAQSGRLALPAPAHLPLVEIPRALKQRYGVTASYSRVWSLIANGALPARREGRQWTVADADLQLVVELLAPTFPRDAA